MMSTTVERIASLAELLDEPLQEKLWEYAELLYVEQVAFESTDELPAVIQAFGDERDLSERTVEQR